MSINLENKQEFAKKFGKNEKDTGSSAVQIAMMTAKIAQLTEHLKSNKKDFDSTHKIHVKTQTFVLCIKVSKFKANPKALFLGYDDICHAKNLASFTPLDGLLSNYIVILS